MQKKLRVVFFPRRLLEKTTRSFFLLGVMLSSASLVMAAETKMPSLFRGVVVADATPGARVLSVDEESIAYAGGLRPGDVILLMHGASIASIDDFAAQSQRIGGKTTEVVLKIERAGRPVELLVSLFSPRLLEAWGERFVPNLELRFRDPKAGYTYWWGEGRRLARERRTSLAIEALATALHYQPDRAETALLLAGQWNLLAQSRFAGRRNDQGVAALQHAVNLYQRLLAKGATAEQLQQVKAQLQPLVHTLGRQLPAPEPEPAGSPPPPTPHAASH